MKSTGISLNSSGQAPFLIFFVGVFLLFLVSCQSHPKRIESVNRLTLRDTHYLDELKKPRSQQNQSLPLNDVGYLLYDPVTKKVLSSHNETMPFIPASTTKVLTSVVALQVLGPQFRFKTVLAYTGRIRGKVLHGDLYLIGDGDPSLTMSHLMSLARTLSDHQISEVTGDFFYDESKVIPLSKIKESGDSSFSHNPGLGALSVDFNQFLVQWQPRNSSQSDVDIVVTPDLPLFEVGLSREPFRPQEEAGFTYEPNEDLDRWSMSSGLSASGERRLPVRHPSLYSALLFARFCKMNGVSLSPPKKAGTVPPHKKILTAHLSPPLLELAERALEFSNNMMTELILLATARQLAGRAVDLTESSRLLQEWLGAHLEPSEWDSLRVVNGSGLASGNRMTPKQLVTTLAYADLSRYQDRSYESLLPASGWKGTLAKRIGLPGSAFYVWAKTGTMFYANALAGYLYTLQGKRFIFAIMASDLKAREMIDRFKDSIPVNIEENANRWTQKARQTQDGILRDWILAD